MSSPSVDSRPVLHPACNRRLPNTFERQKSINKVSPTRQPQAPLPRWTKPKPSPNTAPTSPPLTSPRPPAVKRGNESNGLSSSSEKIIIPRTTLSRSVSILEIKKCKKWASNTNVNNELDPSLMLGCNYSSSVITESPGSIAAVRREQMALETAHRKMRIAHYGRSKSAKYDYKVSPLIESLGNVKTSETSILDRRCTSVTPNSDPVYVAYHDEEWGVPVTDDKMLFELLVLSGAQVGSDWAAILRKRQDYRDAFAGFDAEIVANLTEKQITSISTHYSIDIGRVRGVVDNASRMLEIRSEFGSLAKYIWGFINGKPISPQYKLAHKIPVKTSKSESISKDMVRRGFRTVGPTAIYSFMQAAGLTNDHLTTCYRHLECTLLASRTLI